MAEISKTPEMKIYDEALRKAAKIEMEIRRNGTKDYSQPGYCDESLKVLLPAAKQLLIASGYDKNVLEGKPRTLAGGNEILSLAKREYAAKYAIQNQSRPLIQLNY